LSQLFFYKEKEQQQKLTSSIKLRLTIIAFFFFGGVTGGYGYLLIGIKVLLVSVIILIGALIYDSVKLQLVSIRRKYLR
jgi:uncharacterized membrane protein YoaK (UPF0700 family)